LKAPAASDPSKGLAVLFLASIFFGSAALLVRFATEVSALSLTFFRLSIAAVMMVFFAFLRHEFQLLRRRDLLLVITSGVLLSLHFTTFILAVKETTIANATFLVNTSPVMLAVLSPLLIKERTTSREVVAVVVATLGILLVAHAGNAFRAFGLGDVSALLAAFFVAIYALLGRRLRTGGMSTSCYTAYVYTVATVTSLFMLAAFNVQPFLAYDAQNIVAIIALGVVPTGLGHTLYNYALGSVKTVTANILPLMEPIIASLFAVFLFAETPTIVQTAGYALILLAVLIVVLRTYGSRHIVH
jgi:drug/metabolite transporter (DMT)-like permease